jgi:thiamine-phosphate pyrophosphorylase
MINKRFYKHYVFIDQIDKIVEENLLKFKHLTIIININLLENEKSKVGISIINFARKNKIPFLIKNNYKKCVKFKANGIFIDSKTKSINKPILLKKKFLILGLAHNQLEYFFKKKQNCKNIFLSPIFFNKKYSPHKIYGTNKFRLISLEWKTNLGALCGIDKSNIRKIKLTKTQFIGFQNLIKEKGLSNI